jgi:phage shock protein PspC (stress-responsive transcriptional regulator)
MNKVITINLDGTAFQLEEGGYDALRTYLETASTRLEHNPDRDEILSDIERAIAEKFRARLSSNKTVVITKEVAAVVEEMGPIEADSSQGPAPGASASTGASGTKTAREERTAGHGGLPRRLYKIHEGAMLSGVCNGIAAYFNIDPTLVRLAFVFLTMLWGAGLLVYIVMAIVVPEARSPEEKAAASGTPSTAQEFIRRAKEGYYEAMKGFPDRQARREWSRQFKRQMRANASQWQYNWHSYWAERALLHPGMGFALPFFSLLQGAAAALLICALISLLGTSALFGLALPAKVPVWLAALVLFIAYGVFSAPLKLARRACYWSVGQPRWAWPVVFLLDAAVWLVVAGALLWLGVHFFPEVRQAVQSIPSVAHQAADDIRTWWHGNKRF